LAGGWEFPGGKVEAGESETAAVVRECREELGVEVICRTRVPGEWQVNAEWVLRVYLAEIAAGEALPGADHDQLRWLSRAELFDVDWLPADLPAAVSLAGLLPG
jgi:8-oxo-dGTP diphosphatase